MSVAKFAVAAVAAMLSAGGAGAASYDLLADFDVSKPGASTSGLFTYGYYDNSADTTLSALNNYSICSGDFRCARLTGVDALGFTEYLPGGDAQNGSSFFRTGFLNMHTGPDGQQAAVAFTASVDGTYSFAGRFEFHDTSPSGVLTAAGSLDKSTSYLAETALGAGGRDFSFSQVLTAGQAVVFRIDPTGTYSFDSTGLRLAVVTPNAVGDVPEPATWGTMILGFGLTGAAMRRRRVVAVTA